MLTTILFIVGVVAFVAMGILDAIIVSRIIRTGLVRLNNSGK